MSESKEKKPLTGRRVFIYFLIFFGIIILVNVLFLKVAVRTNPGVISEHTYEKEMKFEKSQHE
jgi:nitrogen fixation protein FixH